MIDIMIGVAITAALSSVGAFTISKVRESAHETKITQDVAVLNSAVQAFQVRGGKFSGGETIESVLSTLKAVAGNQRIPGFSHSLVDDRLIWKMQTPEEAKSDKPRVTWNNASKKFEIAYQGQAGISQFAIDLERVTPEPAPVKISGDESAFLFAENSGWVWDYDEEGEKKVTKNRFEPTRVMLAGAESEVSDFETAGWIPVSLNSEADEKPENTLQPPTFSVPAGVYSDEDFDLAVVLENPNPEGISEVLYSVDYGPWKIYEGTPIIVQGGETIAAKSHSTDSSVSSDSTIASATYQQTPAAIEVADLDVEKPLGALTGGIGSLTGQTLTGSGSKPVFDYQQGANPATAENETEMVAAPEESNGDPAADSAPKTVTLSFADPDVEFSGKGNHYFTNIDGSNAVMGLTISDTSTLISAAKNSGVSGNGDTAAFWITGGMDKHSVTISMDYTQNPVLSVNFMIYNINVSGGGDKVVLTAVTDKGTNLSNPVINSAADADYTVDGNTIDAITYDEDVSEAAANIRFTAPDGENITSILIEWSESSTSPGGYHGIGIGEVTFTYLPGIGALFTEVSPELSP